MHAITLRATGRPAAASPAATRPALRAAASLSLPFAAVLFAAASAAAQSRFEPMDVFQLEYAADPQDLARRRQSRVRAHLDGHHEGPEALRDLDR